MFTEIAKYDMAYIMMHIQGKPENMQNNPTYQNILEEVVDYFKIRIEKLENLGFNKIILDPGFGFGKTLEHNYELLAKMDELDKLNYPVLAGLSRKSMIFRALDITPQESLNGTSVLNTLALQKGAKILRVHDVREAFETIRLFEQYKRFTI
jgi:dihydropteroate synthase